MKIYIYAKIRLLFLLCIFSMIGFSTAKNSGSVFLPTLLATYENVKATVPVSRGVALNSI